MKKLKKLLMGFVKSTKKLYKKQIAAYKDFVKGYKQENRAVKQLEKGLLVLDSSGVNVSGGVSSYLDYRSGKKGGMKHSIAASIRLALEEIARVTGKTPKELDAAIKAAFTKIQKPASKPVKPVWKWVILGIAVLAVLALVALFSLSRKATYQNDNPTETVSDTPACSTWMMEAAPFETKDNKLYVEGLKVIQDAQLGKSSENNEKALEALQMYRNKKIYLLDIAKSELSPDAWAKVDPNAISDTGSCANEATNKLYQDVIFEVMHSDVSIENLPSPSTWYNSGLEKGKIVVDGQKGITGNVKAIVVRHRDGRVTAYLARCGNPVHKDQKGHEKGDTDEHHHHLTPPPPPPNHKSSNPNDYQRPGTDNTTDSGHGTKPKVSETHPADANPPIVSTAKVGGGGVVDTPTKKPGSETGVTAPAAKPAPTTPPAPKPNEGGTNNGVVTD